MTPGGPLPLQTTRPVLAPFTSSPRPSATSRTSPRAPSAGAAPRPAAGAPADAFVFDGFLPVKPGRRVHRLEALRGLETTVVCYESPHRILASLEAIAQVFGEIEIIAARELTKQFEEIIRGTPTALRERWAQGPVRGEFTLVIPYVTNSASDGA